MTKEEYDMFREMFETAAWKQLVSEANEAIEHRKEQLTSNITEQLAFFLRGEITQLRVIANLEEAVDITFMNDTDVEDIE